MAQQVSEKPGQKKRGKVGWVLAFVTALFLLWVLYVSMQTWLPKSGTMETSMPEMARTTETSPAGMPENMPDMNH